MDLKKIAEDLKHGDEVKRGQDIYCRLEKSKVQTIQKRYVQNSAPKKTITVKEMTSEYDWRQFDHKGNYLSSGSTDPVINIEYPTDAVGNEVILVHRDHNLEMKPGYGIVRAIYRLGLKPNILKNGDFRLQLAADSNNANGYSIQINKDGWNLVNGGYPIEESYEQLNDINVAYKVIGRGPISGEAYLQSGAYSMLMGANNQLKISIRCKVTYPAFTVGALVYQPDVPYIKIRLRVKYGTLYLKSDGTWSTTENLVVFYAREYSKYQEFELTAAAPYPPVAGGDLEVRVYHAYTYHAQFETLADMKAYPTLDVSNGYQTEIKTDELNPFYVGMYFFKLNDTTAADDDFNIIRPDDYHATTNPRQWVRQSFEARFEEEFFDIKAIHGFCIDYVKAAFLTDGAAPIDTIVRSVKAETQNNKVFEKGVILGSYSTLAVSEITIPGINLGWFFGAPAAPHSIPTLRNYLSADLIYTGWLRDANGVGYEFWARDGVAESDLLHGILLKSYASQYQKSWRLLRGSIYAKRYFGLLNVARNVNDNNRIYLPMGLTLDDKKCTWSGEFLEIGSGVSGDVGGPATPFTSGFTVGFGSSAFS